MWYVTKYSCKVLCQKKLNVKLKGSIKVQFKAELIQNMVH